MLKAAKEMGPGNLSKCPDCNSYLDQGIPANAEHLRRCSNCKSVFWPLPTQGQPLLVGYLKALLNDVPDTAPVLISDGIYQKIEHVQVEIGSAMKPLHPSNIPFFKDYGDARNSEIYQHWIEDHPIPDPKQRVEPVVIISQRNSF